MSLIGDWQADKKVIWVSYDIIYIFIIIYPSLDRTNYNMVLSISMSIYLQMLLKTSTAANKIWAYLHNSFLADGHMLPSQAALP